jgi:hypothetical protein
MRSLGILEPTKCLQVPDWRNIEARSFRAFGWQNPAGPFWRGNGRRAASQLAVNSTILLFG